MGNLSMCSQNCYLWAKDYDEKMKSLYKLYKNKYRQCIYKQVCLKILKQFKQKNNEDLMFGEEQLPRKSLIDSLHYEESSLSHSKNSLPRIFSQLSPEEKKKQIEELIKKTFIILDLSDIFQEHIEYYNFEIKKKILSSDIQHSLLVTTQTQISEALRKFDPQVIRLLQDYVDFSSKIQQNFDINNVCFMSRLSLNMKSVLINNWKDSKQKSISSLFRDIRLMINILYETICIGYSLSAPSLEILKLEEDEIHYNFHSQTNIWTLISAIIYKDQGFVQFIQTSLKTHLHSKFVTYKQGGLFQNSDIVDLLKSKGNKKHKKGNLAHLFDAKEVTNNYFKRSIQMLNNIIRKPQPILKLKLMAQLQKQIFKELKIMVQKLQIDVLFDRQTFSTIAHWLMHRQKQNNINNIISMIIAYTSNHPNYLIGPKGSALVTFMEDIESIVGEKISND